MKLLSELLAIESASDRKMSRGQLAAKAELDVFKEFVDALDRFHLPMVVGATDPDMGKRGIVEAAQQLSTRAPRVFAAMKSAMSAIREADEHSGWNDHAEAKADKQAGWYIVAVKDDAIADGPFDSVEDARVEAKYKGWYKPHEYDICYGTVDHKKSDKFDVFKDLPEPSED